MGAFQGRFIGFGSSVVVAIDALLDGVLNVLPESRSTGHTHTGGYFLNELAHINAGKIEPLKLRRSESGAVWAFGATPSFSYLPPALFVDDAGQARVEAAIRFCLFDARPENWNL